jgi:hypothetical protein
MDEHALAQLTAEIMSLGYDRATAGRYAVFIGDTPIRDQDDNILVLDGKEVIARLKLKFFSE